MLNFQSTSTIRSPSQDFKIRFTAETGKGTQGDIAIDDTELVRGECSDHPDEV